MADKSAIEWTEATWNPVVGCEHVSPGCDNCYAAREASGRLKHLPLYAGLAVGGKFTGEVRLVEKRLSQPLKWRRPRRVFVNSMSDLFHDNVPTSFIAQVFAVMARTPQHTYQLLTKRHGRMRALLSDRDFRRSVALALELQSHQFEQVTWPLPNVWLGVSVENQQWADIRIPALLATPAAVRFLSCEPLLGPVSLKSSLRCRVCKTSHKFSPTPCDPTSRPIPYPFAETQYIDWVIVGGESGPGARPMHPDWARSLRDQCQAAGVPYFFKQHGEWAPLGPLYEQSDDDPEADEARMEAVSLEVTGGVRIAQLERSGYVARDHQPGDHRTWLMARLGKKQAGRELDGRTHDEYPEVARG